MIQGLANFHFKSWLWRLRAPINLLHTQPCVDASKPGWKTCNKEFKRPIVHSVKGIFILLMLKLLHSGFCVQLVQAPFWTITLCQSTKVEILISLKAGVQVSTGLFHKQVTKNLCFVCEFVFLFLKGFALFKRNYSGAVKAEPLLPFPTPPPPFQLLKNVRIQQYFPFPSAFTVVALVYEWRTVIKWSW